MDQRGEVNCAWLIACLDSRSFVISYIFVPDAIPPHWFPAVTFTVMLRCNCRRASTVPEEGVVSREGEEGGVGVRAGSGGGVDGCGWGEGGEGGDGDEGRGHVIVEDSVGRSGHFLTLVAAVSASTAYFFMKVSYSPDIIFCD